MDDAQEHGGALWAITSYFNPVRYCNRRKNYGEFRRRLDLPLLTVELSFDLGFALGASDAEILIQSSGGDAMWQKERLLNIALEALPPACQKIVWLDCDIVFKRDDWIEAIDRGLDSVPLLQ